MKPSHRRDILLRQQVAFTLWRMFPKAMKELLCASMCERNKYAKKQSSNS